MFSRPAFVARFLARLPDPRALRFRVMTGTGLVAGGFGAVLALAAVHLDARRCAEVAREHAETLAHVAGKWLDGDAHAGLGQAPEKRLSDSTAQLEKLLEESDYAGVVRTLRPKPEAKAALASQPSTARTGALEVVIETGGKQAKRDVDYRPVMEAALFDGECRSVVVGGKVSAFAPVPDSWGAATALVWVEGPASAPLWRRMAFALGAGLFAALLVSFVVWQARRAADRLAHARVQRDEVQRQLASGRPAGAFEVGRGAPSELTSLASALEELRTRMEAGATGQPLPVAPASPAEAAQQAGLGEPSEFDLALLMQQLVEPSRKQAQSRRVDLQLVYPDGVPSQVVGHPMVLFRALEALLRRALRVTREGRITLRVSRIGEGPEGGKLRFEVSDTSPGIAFKEQQELSEALAAAAQGDPEAQKDPLHLASALANSLGSTLSFESQPGQGSRFGFTAALRANGLKAATGFHPQATNGAPARTSFQPRPESVSTPRKTIRMR